MPIEIKITDVSKLTKNELNELIIYLKKTWYLSSPAEEDDPEVIRQEIDVAFAEERLNNPTTTTSLTDMEKETDDIQLKMFVPDATGNAIEVKIDNVNYFDSEAPVSKPRKKRTPKVKEVTPLITSGINGERLAKINEIADKIDPIKKLEIGDTVTITFPETGSSIKGEKSGEIGRGTIRIAMLDDEHESSKEEHEVTHSELVAYILENTRTKKLAYESVMDTLKKFEVPSLNELENWPYLVNPVYLALKEIVNE